MSLRGLLVGVLILTGLETVLSRREAAGRVGGLLESIGRGVGYLLDPSLPAIPNITGFGEEDSSGSGDAGGGIKGAIGGAVKNGLKNLTHVVPDIPGVPQGPITGIPFSPLAYEQPPRHANPTTVEV